MSNSNNKKSANRIIYIEPNDIHGEITNDKKESNVPLTPDYMDYCIWCNLLVEKPSRVKRKITGTTGNSDYYVESKESNFETMQFTSFMQGADKEYNFLTTDYTDIHFTNIEKRNIVEGLGIESMSISLANHFVPEVTINFVDVRGGGFFGREEATHDDDGNLINLEKNADGLIDNFYNCFVSFPYPRFKLQIKGFYGKPVTYQLSCSNFSGTMDSKTGNFNLTVKFIGYHYSILADIPFDYIVAAPLCKYFGESYWEQNVNSAEWSLGNGEAPVKLYDIFRNIQSAIQERPTKELTYDLGEDIQNQISQYNSLRKHVKGLISSIDILKSDLQRLFGSGNFIECLNIDGDNASEQLLLLSSNENIRISPDICHSYNILIRYLDTYLANLSGFVGVEQGLTDKDYPNNGDEKWEEFNKTLTKIFNVVNGEIYNDITKENIINSGSLRKFKVGLLTDGENEGTVSAALKENLKEYVSQNKKYIIENNIQYCCLFDFHNLSNKIHKLLSVIRDKERKLQEEIDTQQTAAIKEIIGFTPYMGPLYKVVLCHVETFVEMLYKVAEHIDSQMTSNQRIPANLGVHIDETDCVLPKNNKSGRYNLPAWPGIFKTRRSIFDNERGENESVFEDIHVDTRGWVGDCIGINEWEEQKFIEEFYLALLKVTQSRTNDIDDSKPSLINLIPLLPHDLYNKIPEYAYENKEMLAFYLGVRFFSITQFLLKENNSEFISLLGKLEAQRYCENNYSDFIIEKNILGTNGETKIQDELYNLMMCKSDGRKQSLPYEFAIVKNNRQPVYSVNKDNEDILDYTYMLLREKEDDSNTIGLIPCSDTEITTEYLRNNYEWDKGCFKVKIDGNEYDGYSSNTNTLYIKDSVNYLTKNGFDKINDKLVFDNYLNRNAFEIITEPKDVDLIHSLYNSLKDHTVYETDFSSVVSACYNNFDNETDVMKDKYKLYSACDESSKYIIPDNGELSEEYKDLWGQNDVEQISNIIKELNKGVD